MKKFILALLIGLIMSMPIYSLDLTRYKIVSTKMDIASYEAMTFSWEARGVTIRSKTDSIAICMTTEASANEYTLATSESYTLPDSAVIKKDGKMYFHNLSSTVATAEVIYWIK